jgi:hypothetical protein
VIQLRNQLIALFFTALCLPAMAAAQGMPTQGLTPIQFQGQGLYLQNCSFCHSPHKVSSQSDVHGNFDNPKSTAPGKTICPDLVDFMNGSNGKAPPPDRALQVMIQGGFPLKMPGFQYGLAPGEIESLIAYMHTL